MKLQVLAAFLSLSSIIQAQIPVNYIYDTDKLPVHGIINPREYSPENLLFITHRSDSYETGTIYPIDGKPIKGFIKYENKKIWFKARKHDEREKLRPEELLGLTIGVDSFFVSKNFNIEQKAITRYITDPQFMQYLTTVGNFIFAKHYHFTSGIGQSYGMSSPIIETFLVSEDEGKTWTSFPKGKHEFKSVATKYFQHVPNLMTKIQQESFGPDDMMTLIKTSEYYDAFKRGEKLYYDRYWNQTVDYNRMVYSVEILSLEDSIWTIRYSNNEHVLYDASYSSLFPHKRHGALHNYQNGVIRQSILFDNDEKKSETINYENGKTRYSVDIRDLSINYSTYTIVKYNQIKDTTGTSLIQSGIWIEEIPTDDGLVKRQFGGNGLLKSYRDDGQNRIHHIIDPDYNFKLKKLQNSLSSYFSEKDFSMISADNAEGMYFVKVVFSDKGKAIDYEIMNSVHFLLDAKMNNWASGIFKENSYYSFKFKPYKIGKEKVYAEFMIPIQFSILKFYRQPPNYDWQFHNQMMFQMQMMQPMNLPTPPPMPTGF